MLIQDELRVELKPFQADFFNSKKRFPAFVGAIATGKTMMLLLKAWRFCEMYPDSLVLIVRKEYTDLRDSTLKDFIRYFNEMVDSNKEYKFPNGSVMMFRHGSELNVLKNINLSMACIEQAEEFETEETFHFLRDRLRRNNAPYRQICLSANANGHNWIWKMWINNPQSEDYHAIQATTFDNADILPADFIADLRRMEIESPNHYKRYVLNCHEELEGDDLLFSFDAIQRSIELVLPDKTGRRLLACDIARFGEDATVFTVLEQKSPMEWQQVLCERHKNKDLMWTVGRFIDLKREFNCASCIVDDDGLGGGVTDRLKELSVKVEAFHGGGKAKDEDMYFNRRAEGYYKLKEMIEKGYLKILDKIEVTEELMTIRYKYQNTKRRIVSKDDMRKEGLKSPDCADSLMMACVLAGKPVANRTFNPETERVY